MTNASFRHNLQDLCDSASFCREQDLHWTALTLFYTAMDMVVAYEADGRCPTPRRDTFIAWAHRYISPHLPSGTSAADLWDGRRQVLCACRSGGAAASDDALGRNDPIAFCGKGADMQGLQSALRQAGIAAIRVMPVDEVVAAFEAGIARYIDELENRPDQLAECKERAEQLLSTMNFWRPLRRRDSLSGAMQVQFVNLLGEQLNLPHGGVCAEPTQRTCHA